MLLTIGDQKEKSGEGGNQEFRFRCVTFKVLTSHLRVQAKGLGLSLASEHRVPWMTRGGTTGRGRSERENRCQ